MFNRRCISLVVASVIVLILPSVPVAQQPATASQSQKTPPPAAKKAEPDSVLDVEALETQRRAFAISLIMSLAEDARSYKNLSLRARILARSADSLWNADSDGARTLFRRAWEAAVNADAENDSGQPAKDAPPAMVIALRKVMGVDLRSEVLNLTARRDRALAEEFLAKLNEARNQKEQNGNESEVPNDGWTTSDETSKRLRVAHRLLDENEVDRAIHFAGPVLNHVNEKTIMFLSKLRAKNPVLADKHFLLMLARAEVDPTADANTVSGLSSYAFTPGFYVTFAADGGIRWVPAIEAITPPDLPVEIRNRFFHVSGNILLRPSPPPDQDFTSAGRTGRHAVITRLLPLFEQYAPETAVALRSQLTLLTEQGFRSLVTDESSLITQGIKPAPNARTILDRLEERIARARNEHERNELYADAAAVLAREGDIRSQDVADKIENTPRRKILRQYVDLSLMQVAIRKKDPATAARLAKSDSLTNAQRAWAYTQVARLLMSTNRTRAVETLEEAINEARRVEADDENRAPLMIGIAGQFLRADNVRPWEIAAEAIKTANALESYSGEVTGLNLGLMTRSGLKLLELDMADFSLAPFFGSLAKADFTRSTDLAKSFKYEGPRAVATLSVAAAAFEKPQRQK